MATTLPFKVPTCIVAMSPILFYLLLLQGLHDKYFRLGHKPLTSGKMYPFDFCCIVKFYESFGQCDKIEKDSSSKIFIFNLSRCKCRVWLKYLTTVASIESKTKL